MMLRQIIVIGTLIISNSLLAQDTLTKEMCRKLALENNLKVKIASNEVSGAEANTRAAQKDLYPVISAQGQYKYLVDPVSIVLDGDQFFGPNNLYEISGSVYQNLYAGGMIKLRYENARLKQSMADNTLNLTTDQLLYHTELRYWNAAWSKESNNVALQYKELLDKLASVIKDKVDIGLVPLNDLLMTQVKQNEAELLISKSRMQHEVALMELNRIMGNMVSEKINVASTDIYSDYAVPELPEYNQVLVDRPEVSIQQDKINLNENDIGLAKSKYAPQIYLQAFPTWGVPNTDLMNNSPIFNAAFIAGVSVPLVQWGKRNFETSEKRFGYESSLLEMEDLRQQISLEVSASYYQVQEAAGRIDLTQASLSKAQENYELIEERYLSGLSPIIELLDAQYSWLLAYNSLLESRLNYFFALTEFNRVIGGI